jgi:hypothetical protein
LTDNDQISAWSSRSSQNMLYLTSHGAALDLCACQAILLLLRMRTPGCDVTWRCVELLRMSYYSGSVAHAYTWLWRHMALRQSSRMSGFSHASSRLLAVTSHCINRLRLSKSCQRLVIRHTFRVHTAGCFTMSSSYRIMRPFRVQHKICNGPC